MINKSKYQIYIIKYEHSLQKSLNEGDDFKMFW